MYTISKNQCGNPRIESLIVSFSVFILFVFQFLSSFSLYYFWNRLNILCYGIFFLINIIFYIGNAPIYDLKNKKIALLFLITWLFVFLSTSLFSLSFHIEVFYVLWGFFFFLFRDDLKLKIFNLFVKIISFFLFLSVIEYLVYITTGNGFILGNVERVEPSSTQYFNHLLFNLVQTGYTPRFQSITEEPGVVGTLCGFLIYIVTPQKNYRFSYLVMWISGVLTMSLAFYVLAVINIISSLIMQRKFKSFLLFLVFIILLILFVSKTQIYDYFMIKIGDRFLAGNILQRNDDILDQIFEDSFYNGNILFGHGHGFHQLYGVGGSGAKVWIIQYGIINLIVVFTLYYYLYFRFVRRYKSEISYVLIFLFVFWISFYQRHFIIYPSYILLFTSCPLIYARTRLL